MSAPEITLYSPSTALIALCQAQVRLLQQCLSLDRCEVYVTQKAKTIDDSALADGESLFVPLVVYPQREQAFVSKGGLISLPQGGAIEKNLTAGSLSGDVSTNSSMAFSPGITPRFLPQGLEKPTLTPEQSLVLPLVYQEEMMGVLVTDRRVSPWLNQELQELEAAAQTLAIACHLDRSQNWYEAQLHQQQLRQQWERDRFDDLLHQLRNPLTALKTFSKLLLKRFGKEEKSQAIIDGIVREGEHLQDLLANFEGQVGTEIAIEKMPVWEAEAYRADLTDSPLLLSSPSESLSCLEINPILNQVLWAETAISQERQIDLRSELADSLIPIWGNANGLREILHNLINNALKYTPSEGIVWVRSGLIHPQHPHWQGIEVADTGFGIPLDDQPHIFERHYRGVQSQGTIQGTGLGLAIVAELVAKMQGQIDLISPNHLSQDSRYPGTTFKVWLKIARSDGLSTYDNAQIGYEI